MHCLLITSALGVLIIGKEDFAMLHIQGWATWEMEIRCRQAFCVDVLRPNMQCGEMGGGCVLVVVIDGERASSEHRVMSKIHSWI